MELGSFYVCASEQEMQASHMNDSEIAFTSVQASNAIFTGQLFCNATCLRTEYVLKKLLNRYENAFFYSLSFVLPPQSEITKWSGLSVM